jgi:hypothetical protein
MTTTHNNYYQNSSLAHQPSSPLRVSFNNSHRTSNLANLPSNQLSQQFAMRQNSLMNVGSGPTAFNFSSLSQSPQTIIRFGHSNESRGGIGDRSLSNNTSMIRIASNNYLANPLIQRRSTVNFTHNSVTTGNYQPNYSQTLLKALPHPPISLVTKESPNRLPLHMNRAQDSPIKIA